MTMSGTQRVIHGVEVIAFVQDSCEGCQFVVTSCHKGDTPYCSASEGHPPIIWLTPLNYIARRLTKGTTP